MIGETSFYGVFVPWLAILALGALLGLWLTRRALATVGFYRWVWHPALFDLALYALLLYAVCRVSTHW
ncbi:MAG: DUF1656 domain-containing protein [Steroidobacteraceae bacterium]